MQGSNIIIKYYCCCYHYRCCSCCYVHQKTEHCDSGLPKDYLPPGGAMTSLLKLTGAFDVYLSSGRAIII